MITNQDRSKWIGASDTSQLLANDGTVSKDKWWAKKLDINKAQLRSKYTITGNAIEHKIIDLIDSNIKKGKRPVYIFKYRLRVNYDGITKDSIIEIKTAKRIPKSAPLKYWQQCQVLMYATGKIKTELWYYKVTEENYNNFFLQLDKTNLTKFDIEYDENWINNIYLPKLKDYAERLRKKRWYHG